MSEITSAAKWAIEELRFGTDAFPATRESVATEGVAAAYAQLAVRLQFQPETATERRERGRTMAALAILQAALTADAQAAVDRGATMAAVDERIKQAIRDLDTRGPRMIR